MKLKMIWTMPAMDLSERIRRTVDLAVMEVAWHLPKRLAYWSFIHQGCKHISGGEIVPDVLYVDVLKRLGKGYR